MARGRAPDVRKAGISHVVRIAAEVVLLVFTVASVAVFLALMLWGAREDGRDQRRYETLVPRRSVERRPRRRGRRTRPDETGPPRA